MSVINALKWSFLAELASKAIQPVVFIVLARLLTPEDLGVMTAAMMVVAFSQIFWDAGMGKALIQRQTDIEVAANAAFWINIALGVLIASLLYLFAQSIALTFFQDERVAIVLQVMTMQVVLGAFSSIQTAMLQKEMGFKKLFWVRFATVSLPGLASIPLAWYGWGYWALVAGTLTGQVAQAIVLWRLSDWRPSLANCPAVTKEIVRFGAWVSMSAVLAWYYNWVDILFLGKFLGLSAVGEYRIATQLNLTIFALIFSPALPVVYSHLSKCLRDNIKINELVLKLPLIATWLSLPVGLTVYVLSKEIVELFLGAKWLGAIGALAGMAVIQTIGHLSVFNGEIYRAIGKPDLEGKVWFFGIFIYTPVYYFMAQTSIEYFILSRIILVSLFLIFHIGLLCMVFKIRFFKILAPQIQVVLMLSIFSFVMFSISNAIGFFGYAKVVFISVAMFISVVTSFYLIERCRLMPYLLLMGSSTFNVEFMKPPRPESGPRSGRP